MIEKINSLPPERVAQVEDFVDFIRQRDRRKADDEAIASYAAEHGGTVADLNRNSKPLH